MLKGIGVSLLSIWLFLFSAQAQPGGDCPEVLLLGDEVLVRDVTCFQELSLAQCIRLALVNNLDVKNQRDGVFSSKQNLRAEENAFDIRGALTAEHNQDVYTPVVEQGSIVVFDPVLQENVTTAAQSAVIDDDITSVGVEVSKLMPHGGVASVRPRLVESDYQRNQWSSGISADYVQPLLDGFGSDVVTASLRQAELGLLQSEYALDSSLRVLVTGVVEDYYALVKTRMLLREQELALERSREQLRAAEIRREEGEVAGLDVLRAQLLVARSSNALIGINNTLENQRIELRLRLGLPPETGLTIEPVEVEPATMEMDLPELVEFALNNRLDLQSREIDMESARLSEQVARNGLLPELDLQASYNFIDGNENLEKVWDVDQGSFGVSVVFRMPLGDVSDEVRHKRAEIALRQSETSLEQQRRRIISEVENAARRILALQNQIEVLRQNVKAAEEAFRLSKLSYEVGGLISSLDLSTAQDDLTSARTDYVSALIDYRIAQAQFNLALGYDLPALIEKQTGRRWE